MPQMQQEKTPQRTDSRQAPSTQNEFEQEQKMRAASFEQEVKKYLPEKGAQVSQDQLLGIMQTAYKQLAGIEAPTNGAITLSLINAELSKHGFALDISVSKKNKLETLALIKFDPNKIKTFDGKRFEALIQLNNYPQIKISEAERVEIVSNAREGTVTPGQTFIRNGQDALVVLYPKEIQKQVGEFKKTGMNIPSSSLTDITSINESSHFLLDALLQGREVNIQGLRIPIKGEIAVRTPPLDTKDFHEIWSDAATYKLTKDLPAAISLLGKQSDQDHAATFQLLNSTVYVALHLWSLEAKNEPEANDRTTFMRNVITAQGQNSVSINFDKLASRMQSDPILRAKISEVVGGVYQSVAGGVLINTLQQDREK